MMYRIETGLGALFVITTEAPARCARRYRAHDVQVGVIEIVNNDLCEEGVGAVLWSGGGRHEQFWFMLPRRPDVGLPCTSLSCIGCCSLEDRVRTRCVVRLLH